jgi:hypothetical protein
MNHNKGMTLQKISLKTNRRNTQALKQHVSIQNKQNILLKVNHGDHE